MTLFFNQLCWEKEDKLLVYKQRYEGFQHKKILYKKIKETKD